MESALRKFFSAHSFLAVLISFAILPILSLNSSEMNCGLSESAAMPRESGFSIEIAFFECLVVAQPVIIRNIPLPRKIRKKKQRFPLTNNPVSMKNVIAKIVTIQVLLQR
jgi:hypothetical protein